MYHSEIPKKVLKTFARYLGVYSDEIRTVDDEVLYNVEVETLEDSEPQHWLIVNDEDAVEIVSDLITSGDSYDPAYISRDEARRILEDVAGSDCEWFCDLVETEARAIVDNSYSEDCYDADGFDSQYEYLIDQYDAEDEDDLVEKIRDEYIDDNGSALDCLIDYFGYDEEELLDDARCSGLVLNDEYTQFWFDEDPDILANELARYDGREVKVCDDWSAYRVD